MKRALVTGSAGFIGGHLVNRLRAEGAWVRGVDIRDPDYPHGDGPHEFRKLDLRRQQACFYALSDGIDEVYQLAASMGGMGFISEHHADLMHDNLLININMLEAARVHGVKRYLFTSSACVYPEERQLTAEATPLKEADAYPANPDTPYGWEKLITERLCLEYGEHYGMQTRIGRFHNCYGPLGTWQGGKEKAPAALCRKVAVFKHGLSSHIELWGDGTATRSFMHVDDCVEGVVRLMRSDYAAPLNIGSSELVSVLGLLLVICDVAGVNLTPHDVHYIPGPVGVAGRNSDNTRIREVLDWEPSITLRDGIADLYPWVEAQVLKEASIERVGVASA